MDAFSAILNAHPEIPSELPANLAAVIRRCLAKQQSERFQSAADLAFALRQSGELSEPSGSARPNLWRGLAIAATAVAIIAFATFAVSQWPWTTSTPAAPLNSTISMTAVTSTGDAGLAQLSPDGKFFAYVRFDRGRDERMGRELGSGSTVRILPESDGAVWGLTITPDSSFVDFVRTRSAESQEPMDLWRVPLLGGPPRKIVDEVASLPGWSPDGRLISYFTALPGEYRLLVAKPDGSEPTRRRQPDDSSPVCHAAVCVSTGHPAGLVLGRTGHRCPGSWTYRRGLTVHQVIRIDVATGAEAELRTTGFGPRGGMVLGRDGQSFIINSGQDGLYQVVKVGLRDGTETRVTNDLASYVGVSTAGDAIVTTRRQTTTELWLLDAAGRSVRQVGRDFPSAFSGLSWSGNSRLLYGATLAGGGGIWSTDLAGTSELVVPGGTRPSTSADGRTMTFFRGEIWRAGADGRHASRLAAGSAAQVSPDRIQGVLPFGTVRHPGGVGD